MSEKEVPEATKPSEQEPARLLVVDDDYRILVTLEGLFSAEGWETLTAQSPLEAMSLFRQHEIAVCLCDQAMPEMNGVELLTLIRQQSPTTVCIMVTGTTDIKLAEEVVNQKLAHYFVTKPWDSGRLREIVHEALDIHRKKKDNPNLAYGEAAHLNMREHANRAAFSLARAVDARDPHTHRHSERVAAFAKFLGRTMGLEDAILEELHIGGLLHDLGKIGVPDEVLLKPGKLTEAEFRYIKMHPVIGVSITEPIDFPWNIASIVRQHHENHDGTGYPMGIGGSEIALTARIIHVVDAYEAMSSDRVYRKALSVEDIEEEFHRCRGTHFDPDVTDVFLEQMERRAFENLPLEQA